MPSLITERSLPAMKLVGIAANFNPINSPDANGNEVIPEIWSNLFDALDEVDEFEFGWAVGVMVPATGADAKPGQLEYFAGLVVDAIPDELGILKVREVAASDYVVCEHIGEIDDLPETTAWFYTDYLPNSGVAEKQAPHLEVYDERFDPESDHSVVMICAPKQ
jgi:predicted transcriptional regulator YdeE